MAYQAARYRCTLDGGIPVCKPGLIEAIAIEAVAALKTNKRVYVKPTQMGPQSLVLVLSQDAPPKVTNTCGDDITETHQQWGGWPAQFLAITGTFHKWIEVPLPDVGSIRVNEGAGDGITNPST